MNILIFHASAGHGHQKVAEVLAAAFQRKGGAQNHVRVFDALDLTPGFFRSLYPAIYFHSVKSLPGLWGWCYETLDCPKVYACVVPFRRLGNSLVGAKILSEVEQAKPEVILCTHFLTAELLSRAKKQGRIKAKIVIVITDFRPHTFWVNPGTDLYWVMSEEGREDLIRRGIPQEKIHAGGIPVDPVFKPKGMREDVLKKHDFSGDRVTLLMTSGSFGLGPQEEILEHLKSFKDEIQCFVVCGKNQELKESLEKKQHAFPVRIFGFVDFMADLMEASDLLIAKPGGATTTESLAKGLPMIVMDPIPGQESRNADILKARNASFFIQKPEQIRIVMETILKQPSLLDEKRRNIRDLARPNAAEELADYVLHE